MAEMVIRCPKCNKGLKLRDSSKLGKKAGCPKCGHTFILQSPAAEHEDEVHFELAEAPSQPLVGTGARWVPDSSAAPATAAAPVASGFPEFSPAPAEAAPIAAPATVPSPVVRRRKNTRRLKTATIAGFLTVVLVGGGIYAAVHFGGKQQPVVQSPPAGTDVLDDVDAQESEEVQAEAEPSGSPLDLWGLPMGARVLIGLRPAELWQQQSRGEEIRYCLGPLGLWAETRLKDICRTDPINVEHALIALIPGVRGEMPKIAAVVRYKKELTPSEFINAFGGAEDRSSGYPLYVAEQFAYMRKPQDLRTVAMCEKGLELDMVGSVQGANSQSDGIDALVSKTDDTRHLTVIFEPVAVRTHHEAMFPPETRPFVNMVLDWFNDDEVETVVWSMHFGEKDFASKIQMRNKTGRSEQRLDREMRQKVKDLPHDLWHMVERMDPKQFGPRKVIGRFPAMMQLYAKSTRGGFGNRYALLETSLTERAAPNLALGALLTWDESTRTDFSKAATQPTQTEEKLPELALHRLKRNIDIEFNRTPLQDAFKYIAEECRVNLDIDGDALKFKGYTQNMPQTFAMQGTGLEGIRKIVGAYPDMCIVIDEGKKQFIVTTVPFAKDKGLTPYEFK